VFKHHTLKMYERVEVKYALLTLALDGHNWQFYAPPALLPVKEAPLPISYRWLGEPKN